MIVNYKIIIENNEEVLCVYLDDFDEEFAQEINENGENKNLLERVRDYIKEKGIKFGGNVVKVLAGTMVVGTMLLAPSALSNIDAHAATTNITHVVESGDSLYTIASRYNTSISELKRINNLTRDVIYPGQSLNISIAETIGTNLYIVVTNDTLGTIAGRHNISISDLKAINNLTSDIIYPGQVLLVNQKAMVGNYTVKSGDTLWSIAKAYNMSWDDIKVLNNNPREIYPGQAIKVIEGRVNDKTYTVQPGDSLWSIARANNMTVSELQSLNNLTTGNIYPGDTLRVSGSTTATVTTPPTVNETKVTNLSVRVRRSSGVVQSIPIEQYVTGVVASELGDGFQKEAYKAQALASRTYAVYETLQGNTLSDTASHQVYKDTNQLRQLWGANYDRNITPIQEAVNETTGEVIKYNGEYINAVFHSTSNGKTESSKTVWGGELPYLQTVSSPWDTKSPYYYRESQYSYTEFRSRLGLPSTSGVTATVISRTSGGGIATVNIGGRVFTGDNVRIKLGLRSTDFDIKASNGIVTISQRGWGHRVGLSQYGAEFMARDGYTYSQIIKHYYQGVDIVRI